MAPSYVISISPYLTTKTHDDRIEYESGPSDFGGVSCKALKALTGLIPVVLQY